METHEYSEGGQTAVAGLRSKCPYRNIFEETESLVNRCHSLHTQTGFKL